MSGPIRELAWLVAGLPLWWLLGAEQFVWPLGTLLVARPLLAGGRVRVEWQTPARWLAAFLVAFWASSFAVEEPLRWATFLRTFAAYGTALLLVLIVTTYARRLQDIRHLVQAVAVAVGITAAAGLLAAAGPLRFSLATPVGMLLPDALVATEYGHQIATRSLGGEAWFAGVGTYYRLNGLSLYANQYATLLAVTLPALAWAAVTAPRRWHRVVYGLVGAGAALNMVLTTSRVAIASTVVAGVAVLLLVARRAPRHRRRLTGALAAVLAAAAMAVVVAGPPASLPGAAKVVTAAQQARGPGSAAGRSAVYAATLDGWRDRPLLGWGTERDVPGVPYPAGSHSHYLGLLYQQGAVGLLLYLGAMGATWRVTTPTGPAASLLRAGRWSFLVVVLDAGASNPSLDATALALIWLTFALLLAAARLQPERTV